jgi:hypothetical protein
VICAGDRIESLERVMHDIPLWTILQSPDNARLGFLYLSVHRRWKQASRSAWLFPSGSPYFLRG